MEQVGTEQAELDVPKRLEDFTPAFLSKVLGVTVTSVDATPIAVGEGFMGKLARLVPRYDPPEAGPRSVVAKVPTDDPGSVALGQMLGLWEREGRFYRDVAPHVSIRTAACHYAGGDDSGIWSLLLEDLSFGQVGDQVRGASDSESERAIDWLAAFHATFWDRGEQAFPWMPRVKDHPSYQAIQPMLEAAFPTFLSSVGDVLPARAIGWVEKSIGSLSEDIAIELTPSTVIHADFRLDNLFFTDEGIIPVDWQSVVIGQPLYDLSYFLGTGVPTEQRRRTERALLERWRAQLVERGVELPEMEALFDLYRQTLLITMRIGALLFGQIDFSVNERAGALARVSAERLFTAGDDLDVGEFVKPRG